MPLYVSLMKCATIAYYCYCFRAQLHTMIAVSVTFLKP